MPRTSGARASAVAAGATADPSQIAPAENALSGALRSLFAVAENYPQLRAVESFLQLQETLTATEDKLEYARRYYNTSARDYNVDLQSFPRNLIAGPFGFTAVAFFAAEAEDRTVPEVKFPGSDSALSTLPAPAALAGDTASSGTGAQGPAPTR
jgi:LemA protein